MKRRTQFETISSTVIKPTRDTLLMLNKSAPYSNKEKVREEDTVKIKFLSCSQ